MNRALDEEESSLPDIRVDNGDTKIDHDNCFDWSDQSISMLHVEARDVHVHAMKNRLMDFRPCQQSLRSDSIGRCSFEVGEDLTIELTIQQDCRAFVVSSVVHTVAQRRRGSGSSRGSVSSASTAEEASKTSYSKMTRMMKLNMTICRRLKGTYINFVDGSFILLGSFPIWLLHHDDTKSEFLAMMHSFLLLASQVHGELQTAQIRHQWHRQR